MSIFGFFIKRASSRYPRLLKQGGQQSERYGFRQRTRNSVLRQNDIGPIKF